MHSRVTAPREMAWRRSARSTRVEITVATARELGQGSSSRTTKSSRRGMTASMPNRLVTTQKAAIWPTVYAGPVITLAAKKLVMKPSEPPALPIVETMTISPEVMRVRESTKPAKKKSAAMLGPSSMMPKLSVRKEFIAQSAMASTRPATRDRGLGKAWWGAASGMSRGPHCRRGASTRRAFRPKRFSRRTAVTAHDACGAFQRGTRSPPRSKVPCLGRLSSGRAFQSSCCRLRKASLGRCAPKKPQGERT